jgi:hypothetical protein
MPRVNVPGFPRPVLIELHDPVQLGSPLLGVTGTPELMTTEQFAQNIATDSFSGTFENLSIFKGTTRAAWAWQAQIARRYQQARRAYLRGRIGRPYDTTQFSELDDFLLIVRYFQTLGDHHPVRSAEDHWAKAGLKLPTQRLIVLKLRLVKKWAVPELRFVAEHVCNIYGLPPLPRKKAVHRRKR